MPKTQVGDIRIHYQVAGKGTPLVMIMGWGGDHTVWGFQLPAFSREFRCVVFDNRGSGQTDQPDIRYTIRMMADDTVGLMDALGIDWAHILGVSMGGMIAQEIALNYPNRVRSLQLHCTLARPDAYLAAVTSMLLRAKTTFAWEEFVRAFLTWMLTPKTYLERPEFVEMLVKASVENPYPASVTGLTRQTEACLAHNTLDRLHQIQCPTLITVGTEDIFVPLRFSRLLHERITGSELVVIPESGHGHFWEQPATFNDACLHFLRKRSR